MRLGQNRLVARIVERVAVGLVLVVLVFWLLVVRAYEGKLQTEQQAYRRARVQKLAAEARVARLEKIRVTGADEKLNRFLSEHMSPRRRCFSKAAGLVRQLAEESGVQLSGGVSYRLGEVKSEPLQRLGIEVSVQGPFPSLLSFAHGVETSSDFVVLRGFSLETGDGGALALRMTADLYVTP